MKTVTIPENEYLQMQQTIADLKNQMKLLRDEDFIRKLSAAYRFFCIKAPLPEDDRRPSLTRGAGKEMITYMAEDFDEPLEDFREYME